MNVESTTADSVAGRKPIVVLLVDDQRFIGMAVSRLIATEQDIQLHCCYSAEDAVAQANLVIPDVIFQDLQMPGIDGLTLVGNFRSNPPTAATRIVVLSGNDDAASRAGATAAGADDYLVKLPKKEVLLECIRRTAPASAEPPKPRPFDVAQGRPEPVEDRASELSANADVTLDSSTIAGIRDTFTSGGADLVAKLIDQFVKEASSLVDRLTQAVERGDVAALKAIAHSLKGTSLTIGAMRLARLTGEVEAHVTSRPEVAVDAAMARAIVEELGHVRAACAREKAGAPPASELTLRQAGAAR